MFWVRPEVFSQRYRGLPGKPAKEDIRTPLADPSWCKVATALLEAPSTVSNAEAKLSYMEVFIFLF